MNNTYWYNNTNHDNASNNDFDDDNDGDNNNNDNKAFLSCVTLGNNPDFQGDLKMITDTVRAFYILEKFAHLLHLEYKYQWFEKF